MKKWQKVFWWGLLAVLSVALVTLNFYLTFKVHQLFHHIGT